MLLTESTRPHSSYFLPTPANYVSKVYESFLASASSDAAPGAGSRAGVAGAALRPETLMPAAQRTAHHISHLLREQRAKQAAYLRNVDCPQAYKLKPSSENY